MTHITNNLNIPLVLAAWLVHDEYDYISAENYMSATGLMKPLRHILLPQRILPEARQPEDVEDYIARGLGHSIHDSIEKAWETGYETNLRKLGYSEEIIRRILINPTEEQVQNTLGAIPVYMEQRMFRKHRGLVLGGKFDNLTDGLLNDTKTTSAWAWAQGTRDYDFKLQGSIYRWIDAEGYSDQRCRPEDRFRPRVTEDYVRINFVFTDWQKSMAKANPGYPQKRVEYKDIPLMSLEETEDWINDKINQIQQYSSFPEDQIPHCTPDELWQSAPKYKYFKDPAKANQAGARSTKNFDDLIEARQYQAEKGGAGVIKTIPGEAKRCAYCPAYDICTQKDSLGV